jgi:DNA helicase-2/ATP-dependent DNA helicase PcrA
MTFPGPDTLGRGIVVRAGAPVPPGLDDAPVVTVDAATLEHPARVQGLVERLHRSWVHRERLVVAWDVPDDALAVDERFDDPPWHLDAGFLFPLERLRFLAFTNNYDARAGSPRWWWAYKAQRSIGATPGGAADVVLPDGTAAWIDGGPREPLPPLDVAVISGESVDVGGRGAVPPPAPPVDGALAPDQLDAVRHRVGPARVIAPAGSGKTRTLAARLRHLVDERGVEPGLVTAVAYNNRAAAELRDRLGVDRSVVRTIHSLGWAILNQARPGLELIDEAEVRNQLGRLVSVPRRANADPLGPYVEALEQVRAGLLDPEDVEAERDDIPGFASVFEDYRSRLYRRGRVDHGEQVYGAIEAVLRDPALRARWQQRTRHLLVDEFQDLTPAYLLLIRLVASPQLQVFGVGDDDQVIYGYAGADPAFLIDFERYFPGAGEHALEINYRCPPVIVAAAGHVLGYNSRRIEKEIRAGRAEAAADALEVDLRDTADLAVAAADRISGWLESGVAPPDVAVLTRVNASLIPVKAALVERGIPTADLLDAGSLQRTTLRALFAWLAIGLRPERIRRRDALEAIRRPARGLTTVARELVTRSHFDLDELVALGARLDGKQAERWDQLADDLVAVAETAARNHAAALLDFLTDRVGLASSARNLDAGRSNASRSSHLDDLVAVRRAAALHDTLDDFVPWLRASIERTPAHRGVVLSSVHRVKGMEWSRVIVFGADRGTMPHDLADDVEEERRVFHVAITRAIDEVVVLADRDRPSRFLAELDGSAPKRTEPDPSRQERLPVRRRTRGPSVFVGDEVTVSGGYTGTVVAIDRDEVSVRLATGDADLIVPVADVLAVSDSSGPAAAGMPDPAVVDALRMWRRETSERLAVPAYVVMHDTTLEAIAAARPSTERQLINVPGIGPAKLEQYGDEILALVDSVAAPSR